MNKIKLLSTYLACFLVMQLVSIITGLLCGAELFKESMAPYLGAGSLIALLVVTVIAAAFSLESEVKRRY